MSSHNDAASSHAAAASASSNAAAGLEGLAQLSLQQHSQQGEASLVLRSLYPSTQHTSVSGFQADAPLYRSVHMAESCSLSPAPIDLHAAGLDSFADKPYFQYADGRAADMKSLQPPHAAMQGMKFIPQQQLQFSKATGSMELPPQEDALKPQAATPVPAPAPAVAAAASAAASESSDVPPPCPSYLEPQSHFFCTVPPPSKPMLLYDTVQQTLQSLHESGVGTVNGSSICTLDCQPAPARFKIVCTAYCPSGIAVPFVVRIYTADAKQNKYCVEFQRRQGDVVRFFQLFRTARARIQSTHPLTTPVEPRTANPNALGLDQPEKTVARPKQMPMRSWSAPTLPSGSSSFCKEHFCGTVRSLLQMCSSPCLDIKLQGVLALAELSCSESFESEVLVAEGCCTTFLQCLPDEHEDLHRASLTALANLCETQRSLCAQLVADERHLDCLLKLARSDTAQVVRQCARIWSSCAAALGRGLLDKLPSRHRPSFCDVVQQLRKHGCKEVKQHAQIIQEKANIQEAH